MECGAGAPLSGRGHQIWRPAATVLALTALLVIGTVAAAYAALTTNGLRTVMRPSPVAQVPPTHPVTPVTPAPPTLTGPTATPPPAAKPAPVAPIKPVTPPAAVTPTPTPKALAPTTTTTHTSTTTSLPAPNPSAPAPAPPGGQVVLDPFAGASTYNPGGYPDGAFTDPSLSIDGDPSTAWNGVQPSHSPALDAGVVLDLNTPQRLGTLTLVTDTPGISVGIYGAHRQQPTAFPDPAWKLLSPVRRTNHSSDFSLQTGGSRYRFVLVWVTSVPKVSRGADLNEISLTY